MTEALIGRLSRIHDLRVISRTSVMRFKDTSPHSWRLRKHSASMPLSRGR
jgi:TolB-like protein